jgi:hypothetical protein
VAQSYPSKFEKCFISTTRNSWRVNAKNRSLWGTARLSIPFWGVRICHVCTRQFRWQTGRSLRSCPPKQQESQNHHVSTAALKLQSLCRHFLTHPTQLQSSRQHHHRLVVRITKHSELSELGSETHMYAMRSPWPYCLRRPEMRPSCLANLCNHWTNFDKAL